MSFNAWCVLRASWFAARLDQIEHDYKRYVIAERVFEGDDSGFTVMHRARIT